MATDESSSPSSPSADSYLGSVISLTSKSEIRYEGILAAINTSESTIALQNVRSFGTEGRKRNGIQVPPRNEVFECILFRGSDIKDLQVKSSTASFTMTQMQHDPAIVQSHYVHAPTSYPSAVLSGGGTHAGTSSDASQSAVGDLAFSNAHSLHQTGGHLASGVSSALPTSTHGAPFIAPMYFQGYADPLNFRSHGHQHSVAFRPPPAMQQNQLQQPEGHAPTSMPSLLGIAAAPLSFSSTAVPSQNSIFNLADFSFSNPVDLSSMSSAKSLRSPPSSSIPSPLLTMSSFSSYNPELNITMNPLSSKAGITSTSVLSVPCVPYSSSLMGSPSGPLTTGPLLTPDQLTNSEPPESPSVLKLYSEQKDMGALLPFSLSNLSYSGSVLPQVPLLPLPLPSQQGQQTVADFGEEFDFTAMNEKFDKNEVWGSLGKAEQRETSGVGTFGNLTRNNVEFEGVPDQDPRFRNKPVYNKDDFFDTLSCNSLNRYGRTRYSDRMRLDTETFGGQRPPLGRGNYGPAYTGNFRGSYNQGRGYGYYSGRGHGGYNLSHN